MKQFYQEKNSVNVLIGSRDSISETVVQQRIFLAIKNELIAIRKIRCSQPGVKKIRRWAHFLCD